MENLSIYDKLDELNEGLEYNGGGIETLLNGRVVKSVQRGVFSSRSITANKWNTLANISSVDSSKSFLLVTLTSVGYGTSCYYRLSNNKIEVYCTGSSLGAGDWQVVEFY